MDDGCKWWPPLSGQLITVRCLAVSQICGSTQNGLKLVHPSFRDMSKWIYSYYMLGCDGDCEGSGFHSIEMDCSTH